MLQCLKKLVDGERPGADEFLQAMQRQGKTSGHGLFIRKVKYKTKMKGRRKKKYLATNRGREIPHSLDR